ncbi:response regulator transcription factor [Paenibacillus ehimensis]|uniref:response regulator transcription factor n=1 Tax=Paenibacillus ehimensis TaxID=79264 RepID=UPI000FDA7166|nr:response regulator transcription factor [Paenibacillus ehimensis]
MYRVFLVDDEPFIMEGLAYLIDWERHGLQIVGKAGDGAEALEALAGEPIDILITDIQMPRMNGLELIRSVRELQPDVKFIILSGYNDFDYVKEGVTLGIENYLLKPVNTEELIRTLTGTVAKIEQSVYKEESIKRHLEIIRDNLLYRWVTAAIEPEELRNREELLGIRLGLPGYVVGTVKLLFDQEQAEPAEVSSRAETIAAVRMYCQRTVQSYGPEQAVFADLEGDLVLLAGLNDGDADRIRFVRFMAELQAAIRERWGLPLLATVGEASKGDASAHRSYRTAKRMQDYYVLAPHDGPLVYEAAAPTAAAEPAAPAQAELAHFCKLLSAGKKDEALAWVREAFARLRETEGLAPSDIQNTAMAVLAAAVHHANLMRQEHEGVISDYKHLFSQVVKPQTMQELEELVERFVDRVLCASGAAEREYSPVIRQVLLEVERRYGDELSLKTLSQAFHMNPVYLGQLFHKETGETFSDYVNKYRLAQAKALLVESNLKTSDISVRVGYTDTSYFYKQFRKYYGFSPTEYRNWSKLGGG